jgi:hypothetical protein
MCYASHLLEHLDPESASKFLQECSRALAPGGLIRIVVPDLEVICRRYIAQLEKVAANAGNEDSYDWSVLELMDQLVRTQTGGRVMPFLRNSSDDTRTLVLERWGAEAAGLFELANAQALTPSLPLLKGWIRKTRSKLAQWVTGFEPNVLETARFRSHGEVHQWMYDRFSLKRLLDRAGFVNLRACSAQESRLPGWPVYELDADLHGRPHKPDSLFMEGVKLDGAK